MAAPQTAEGIVLEALPNDLFRVKCKQGNLVIASLGGSARQGIVRILPGERVLLELSSRDPSRGKIIRQLS